MAVCPEGAYLNLSNVEETYSRGYFPCWEHGISNFTNSPRFWFKDEDFQCPEHYDGDNCFCPKLAGNSDIAGSGVIFAFLFTAGLTIVPTALCLLLSRRSSEKAVGDCASSRPTINPIDGFFRKYCSDSVRHHVKSADLWADCLADVIKSLSDQQLVTGFAVLVAGFIGVYMEKMTVYHFSIVANLAWFASNTHLLSLIIVRSYQDSVKPGSLARESAQLRRHSQPRLIQGTRVMLMVLMACLLLVSSWMSAFASWDDEFNCPVKCTLGGKRGEKGMRWMAIDVFYVLYSYPQHIAMLHQGFRIWWIDKVRPRLLGNRGQLPGSEKTSFWDTSPILHVLGRVFRCIWYFLSAEVESILELVGWFTYNAIVMFRSRRYGHSIMKDTGVEDQFGFGQLLPLFLLALPVLQFFESYAKRSSETRRDGEGCAGSSEYAPLNSNI